VRLKRGFALISVLWSVGLLAAVAAVLLRAGHADLVQAQTDIALARAQASADGAARLAILKALDQPLLPWDGQVRDGVAFQDEGGLVDLNSASPALLAILLRQVGAAPEKAAAIVAARGPETAPTPFYSTLDLARVPAIGPALLHRLLPLITVHSGQTGIDPKTAPALLADGLPAPAIMDSRHGVVRISAAATTDGVTAWRTADVRILRQGVLPYRVLTWTTAEGGAG
jgi:general secretion pathway protein K